MWCDDNREQKQMFITVDINGWISHCIILYCTVSIVWHVSFYIVSIVSYHNIKCHIVLKLYCLDLFISCCIVSFHIVPLFWHFISYHPSLDNHIMSYHIAYCMTVFIVWYIHRYILIFFGFGVIEVTEVSASQTSSDWRDSWWMGCVN